MGRGHCLLNILGHEAAHRLLFPNRRANDFVGRWLLAYPTFQAVHRLPAGPLRPPPRRARPRGARHRAVPGLPDRRRLVAPQAAPRPLRRAAPTRTSRASCFSLRKRSVEAWQILAVQAVLLGASIAVHAPARLRRVDRVVVARCGSSPTGCGRSPSTAAWSARRTAAARPTSSARRRIARYLHGAVQHRLAPRPPRRHGRAVAQPARAARRAGRARAGWCPTSSTRRTGRSGRPARPASRVPRAVLTPGADERSETPLARPAGSRLPSTT